MNQLDQNMSNNTDNSNKKLEIWSNNKFEKITYKELKKHKRYLCNQ